MRVLLQRVKQANVTIEGNIYSTIDYGILIFLGVTHQDTSNDATYLAQRSVNLRIFEDNEGKMNLSLKDVQGKALVVSQFTLYADTQKGHRPSFTEAARPDVAEHLYNDFIAELRRELGESNVATGVFRAMMDVSLINDGPVTIMIESKNNL